MNYQQISKHLGTGLFALASLLVTACSQSQPEPKPQSEREEEALKLELSTIDKTLASQTEYDLHSDSLVLVSLYKAMGGNAWHRNSNWLSSAPLTRWQGVHTKRVDGKERVYALYIGGNNLRGTIPPSIKYLSALRVLQLKHNYHIDGTIPEGIYELRQLKTLDLSFTGLRGELSPKVGQLTELDSLNLWTGPWDLRRSGAFLPNPRRLSGQVPKELGELKKARYISVFNQNFSGSIPKELSGLVAVEELSLQGNALTGEIPVELGQLTQLKKLYLGANQLSGTIPAALSGAKQLDELILSHNSLSGELPASISELKRLHLLAINHNKLSGKLPATLADMPELFKLDLRNNSFEGELPKRLGGVQQDFLRIVDIRNNHFEGALPPKVAHKLRNLEPQGVYPYPKHFYTEYRIAGNRFVGELPIRYQDVHRDFILPQQAGFGFTNYR